jgi:SP family facilitated glucose transporter-like MFS transporter 1
MGAMNVLMTVISLVMVEKAGRKTLLLFGLSGMCIDVLLLFFCIQNKVIYQADTTGLYLVSVFLF